MDGYNSTKIWRDEFRPHFVDLSLFKKQCLLFLSLQSYAVILFWSITKNKNEKHPTTDNIENLNFIPDKGQFKT